MDNKNRYPNSNGRTELRSLIMRKCAKRKICIINAKSILDDARRSVARQRQITMKTSIHNSNSLSRNYDEKGEQAVRYEHTTHLKNLEKCKTHASSAKTRLDLNVTSITNYQVKINSTKKKATNERTTNTAELSYVTHQNELSGCTIKRARLTELIGRESDNIKK